MSEPSERSSYQKSCMGLLVDIQTVLKPIEKNEIHFYDHFRTRSMTTFVCGKYESWGREILTSFESLIWDITIWIDFFDSLETMRFSAT